MKKKQLLPLIIIVVVLLALVLLKRSREQPPGIVEEVGLVSLFPAELSKGDIAKLELYSGAKPDEKVVLAWEQSGDKWLAATHYNAPVTEDKIDKYLTALADLKGEFRASADSDQELEEYNLTESLGFHLVGYQKDSEPAFHFLVGKSPKYSTALVRKADERKVYVIDTNPRREAGIFGSDTEEAPKTDTWLDKKIVTLEKEKINRLEISTPDKKLTFELQEKKAEEETETAPETQEESTTQDTTAGNTQVEKEWVLVDGGFTTEYKQTALDSLLGRFQNLTATDIVDPGKKADWGLEPPGFKCTVSLEGQNDVVLEGGWPDPASEGYIRVASAKEDLVYKLSRYTFEQIFPKGSQLFDISDFSVEKDSLTRIELTQPEGNIVLAKKEDEWIIEEPSAALAVQSSAVDDIVNTLSSWKPEDYSDSREVLSSSTRSALLTMTDETVHELNFGADSKHIDGVYAAIGEDTHVLVMARRDFDKVFPAPKDLYDSALFDLDMGEIAEIEISHASQQMNLAKEGDTWKYTAGDSSGEAEGFVCDNLVSSLASLQAEDILFGMTELEGETYGTIRFKTEDDAETLLTFGPEQDGVHFLEISGKKPLFSVNKDQLAALFPTIETLKKPEPVPEQESEPTTQPAETTSAATQSTAESN